MRNHFSSHSLLNCIIVMDLGSPPFITVLQLLSHFSLGSLFLSIQSKWWFCWRLFLRRGSFWFEQYFRIARRKIQHRNDLCFGRVDPYRLNQTWTLAPTIISEHIKSILVKIVDKHCCHTADARPRQCNKDAQSGHGKRYQRMKPIPMRWEAL